MLLGFIVTECGQNRGRLVAIVSTSSSKVENFSPGTISSTAARTSAENCEAWSRELVDARAALAARKAQGAKLGNPTNMREAGALGRQALTAEADAFAANVMPIVESLRCAGIRDLRGLAAALNTRGVRTARGGRWHVSNVKNVIDRVASF